MTNITRWDPFRDFWGMRSLLDRFYDTGSSPSGTTWFTTALDLALDVAETDAEYVVKASLPGINPDELEITYDSNVLTIKGEIRKEDDYEDERYHIRERRFGSFSRSISLPYAVKADEIEANYEAGILKLILPKSEEAKPKRIKIRGDGGAKMIEGKSKSTSKN